MQENEFEKQVQQKMDELKLIPSGAVWQRIEPQIKKEKRRRWLLIFLPVILIGFLYGGYLFVNRSNTPPEAKQGLTNNLIKKNNVIEKTKADFDSAKNNASLLENKNTISKIIITKGNGKQKIKTQGKLKITIAQDIDKSLTKDITNKKVFDTTQNIIENGSLSSNIKNPEQEKILPAGETKPDTITILKEETANDITIDSIKNNAEKKNENVIDTPHKNMITPNKHLWSWGFSLSVGVSGMANNLFGSQDKNSASAFLSSAFPAASGSTATPSLIRSSIAFLTGVSVERKIHKIIFTTGLNYKLFSTTNTTGTDSANYFRATSNINTYHNFYHYIELPVGIKFQIVNSKKIKLNWNIGSSIAQLIGSNALQFNNITGLYFHDNSLFNKTQFGFNTGLDIALFSKQNRSLLIGPYFNYGISKIASQGYNKHHFTFTGLRAQIIFRKK